MKKKFLDLNEDQFCKYLYKKWIIEYVSYTIERDDSPGSCFVFDEMEDESFVNMISIEKNSSETYSVYTERARGGVRGAHFMISGDDGVGSILENELFEYLTFHDKEALYTDDSVRDWYEREVCPAVKMLLDVSEL